MAAVYDHHCVYVDVYVLWQQFRVVTVYMFRHMLLYVYIFYNQQFMVITVLYMFAAFCTATNLGWLSQHFHVAFSQTLFK